MELQGKVALVTGAGSGIGEASALRLAKAGARVGVLSHTEDEIAETAKEIAAAGGTSSALLADVRDAPAMRQAIDSLVEHWGRLDIVFANAGINGVWAPIDKLEPEEWDLTIESNLRGTFLTLRYAVPHLKATGSGHHQLVDQRNPDLQQHRRNGL